MNCVNTLRCPVPAFRLLLRILAGGGHPVAVALVGVRRVPGRQEWLVREVFSGPAEEAPSSERAPRFIVSLANGRPPAPQTHALRHPLAVGALELGDGPWRGHVSGIVRGEGLLGRLDRLVLVGPGMHEVALTGPAEPDAPEGEASPGVPDTVRWSRTIGALGGEDIWRRLVRLRVAVIGCGRTGSLVAAMLAGLGIRHLTLIDPDVIEFHNLGEMDVVTDADLGRPKAEALAERLGHRLGALGGSVQAVVAPVSTPRAIGAAITSDVLFCCPDNDAARLAAAIIATMYHRVLVDIGTGIHYPTNPLSTFRNPQSAIRIRRMGADVRLIVPGDGCLLCRGGLTDYGGALEDLITHRQPQLPPGSWQTQRAGSLRSLNQLAAALAVRMLEDLVAERIQGSTWARVNVNEAGRVNVDYPLGELPPASRECPLCAKAGLGDEGWPGGHLPGPP